MEIKEREIEKIDTSFSKRKSQAKTVVGMIQGDLDRARNDGNFIMSNYLEELIKRCKKVEEVGIVQIHGWKGKSPLKVIKKPDKIIAFKWQKIKGEQARQNKFEYSRSEVNMMINSIKSLYKGDWIESKEIMGRYLKMAQIGLNHKSEHLFGDGEFIFDRLFCWRKMHNHLVILLDILDSEGLIEYKGGRVKVL